MIVPTAVGVAMLSLLFHHVIPASLYGGQSAFPILSRINRELRHCQRADFAAIILEKSKRELYRGLRARFDSVVGQALTLKILNLCLARYHFHTRSASVVPPIRLFSIARACVFFQVGEGYLAVRARWGPNSISS